MSMENKLYNQFKQQTTHLETPASLDSTILRNYKQLVMQNRSEKMRMKAMYKKVILVAAVVLILCGFGIGAKLLTSTSNDFLTLNYYSTSQFDITEKNINRAMSAIEEVKSELQVGERAVIYMPEINKTYPLLSVAHFEQITEWEQWGNNIAAHQLKLEQRILNETFVFHAGIEDHPYYPILPIEQEQLIAELKEESKQAEAGEVVWKHISLAPADYFSQIYATQYVNEAGVSIYVVAMVNDTDTVRIDGYLNEQAILVSKKINDLDVIYVKRDQALTESRALQLVEWIEETSQGSVLYSILTESDAVTESMLYEVAEQIIN